MSEIARITLLVKQDECDRLAETTLVPVPGCRGVTARSDSERDHSGAG